jgi:hypothetical protein
MLVGKRCFLKLWMFTDLNMVFPVVVLVFDFDFDEFSEGVLHGHWGPKCNMKFKN